jgi:cobalt-zinc-cadmium efflux system outer membrane protein
MACLLIKEKTRTSFRNPKLERFIPMNSTVPRGVTIVGIMLALAVITQEKPATAQEEPHALADSLTTVFETADDEADSTFMTIFDEETVSLEDYLAYAALHSPALRAAFNNWKASLERSGYAGAMPDPRFTYTYFIENVETRVGPQNHLFRLQQAFPWFGTLGTRKDIAAEAARADYQRFEAEKLRLFFEVKSAFYEYFYLDRAIAITRDNLELLAFWENIAQAKYRVALRRYADLIKAQVEIGKLEDRLLSIEDSVGPVAARLKAAANLPDSLQLPLPTLMVVEEAPVQADSLYALALANNPDLKSLLHIVEKGQAARTLAAKASYPDFVVGVGYINVGEALDPTMIDSGKDTWTATVGVTLPLWFGANSSRRQEAEAQYYRSRYSYADARKRLRAFTEMVVFEYEDALRKTKLYRDGLVPKAEQSLNASYTAYQAGETDFLDLLDAQRQLLDFQLQFERSRSNLAIRRAELEMITGTELVDAGEGEGQSE